MSISYGIIPGVCEVNYSFVYQGKIKVESILFDVPKSIFLFTGHVRKYGTKKALFVTFSKKKQYLVNEIDAEIN